MFRLATRGQHVLDELDGEALEPAGGGGSGENQLEALQVEYPREDVQKLLLVLARVDDEHLRETKMADGEKQRWPTTRNKYG